MTWPSYSPATRKAVNDLLKKGGSLSAYRANPNFPSWTGPTEGSYAYKLEREIEKRFKVKHAVAVSSGTAGLHTALVAAGITSGEVITSPYTFSATVASIILAGATPVFADVDPYSFTITAETVKRVVTKRTRCVLPVDLFGGLAPTEEISQLGFPVISDSCQSVGAVSGGAYSGTRSLAAAYSFNGGKQVPAGEAGAMITNDSKLAERARMFMNHGENFHSPLVGVNYRMNEPTACIAYHGLLELEERNKRRQEMAADFYHTIRYYDDEPRTVRKDHVYYCTPFIFRKDNREEFIKKAKKVGVTVGAGYIQPPLDHYKAFKKYSRGPLYTVNELSAKSLCLLYDLTPDKHKDYGKEVGAKIRKIMYGSYGPV